MFEEGQRYRGAAAHRVYRNLRMAGVLALFAVIVFALILSSALSASTPSGARDFGLVVVGILALYVGRAVLVEVRVSRDGVVIRNILRTYRLRWTDVAAVRPVPVSIASPLGGMFVGFTLNDGRVIRPQALRRSETDADLIARDLSRIAAGTGGADTRA